MKLTSIQARNLNEAWFKCLESLLSLKEGTKIWKVEGKIGESTKGDLNSRSYIGSGSFVGSRRWEFEHITLHITHPGERPLIPDVPAGVPAPTDMQYVENYYLNYLVGTAVAPGETYSYGSRIMLQLEKVIEKFVKGGFGTNQCTIAIAQPSDIELPDPPCLRTLDFRVYPNNALNDDEEQALHMFCHFRSWDLWGGLSSNLAGLRLLQEEIAASIGVPAGEIVATSKGLHLYEDSWNLALKRAGEKEISAEELLSRLQN